MRFPFTVVDGEVHDESGKALRLDQERLIYALTARRQYREQLHVYGWMGDRMDYTAPIGFIASYGGYSFASQNCLPRPDLVALSEGMTMAGFKFDIALNEPRFEREKFCLYAVFDSNTFARATLPEEGDTYSPSVWR